MKRVLFLALILCILSVSACTAKAEACPSPTADTKLMTNTEDGYCLLYPAEDVIIDPYVIVANPNSAPGDMPGEAWAVINTQDAAGRTASQVADEMTAAVGPGFNITQTEIEVGGEQAIVVDGMPGQDSNRMVLIIHEGRLYTLTVMPWYPSAGSSLDKLYNTIIQSLHFMSKAAQP